MPPCRGSISSELQCWPSSLRPRSVHGSAGMRALQHADAAQRSDEKPRRGRVAMVEVLAVRRQACKHGDLLLVSGEWRTAEIAHGNARASLRVPTRHNDVVLADPALRRRAKIIRAVRSDPAFQIRQDSRGAVRGGTPVPSFRSASMTSTPGSHALIAIISGLRIRRRESVGERLRPPPSSLGRSARRSHSTGRQGRSAAAAALPHIA